MSPDEPATAQEREQTRPYVGRFAPSPTGPLHAGSLVAALASWLDARAHGGRWLVRIEDVDGPRCVPGATEVILAQLQALGLVPDEPPVRQSDRGALYEVHLQRLIDEGWAYGCACTRAEIAAVHAAAGVRRDRHAELVYPGTCRPDRRGLGGRAFRAVRVSVVESDGSPVFLTWEDRRLGRQHQRLSAEVGDFVLRRADGLWAYQLAVVVDDAMQGVTDVVRGEDLADNTPRQIWLQRRWGFATPRYLHVPLVRDAQGEKLSKQHGAPAVNVSEPLRALQALRAAGGALGLPAPLVSDAGAANRLGDWLALATRAWAAGLRG